MLHLLPNVLKRSEIEVKEEKDFMRQLGAGIDSLGLPELDDAALQRLYIYFKELRHWSRKINLIAKKATDTEILEKHFLDSLTLLPLFTGDGAHLLDIGTGAGFPGLVCKAVKPELRVTLVEPRLKRVSFLSHVIRKLQLEDITLLRCRVEDEKSLTSDMLFSHIVSRAVSDIKVFLEMSSRFVKPGVQVICMKGPKWEEELAGWQKSGGSDDFTLVSQKTYVLPESGAERHLLLFEGVV